MSQIRRFCAKRISRAHCARSPSRVPRAFYEGPIAEAIVNHLQEGGAPFAKSDLENYRAEVVPALTSRYHGHEVATIGMATGGTTLTESLRLLDVFDIAALGHNSIANLHLQAEAYRIAFAVTVRLSGGPEFRRRAIRGAASSEYLDRRQAGIRADRVSPICAGSRAARGQTRTCRIDGRLLEQRLHHSFERHQWSPGMAVSLTQTLLISGAAASRCQAPAFC